MEKEIITSDNYVRIRGDYWEKLIRGAVIEFTLSQNESEFYPPGNREDDYPLDLANNHLKYLYVLAEGPKGSYIALYVKNGSKKDMCFDNIYDVHFGEIQKITLPDRKCIEFFYFKMENGGRAEGRIIKVKTMLSNDPALSTF